MNIDGYYFEAGGSTRVDARLVCLDEQYQLYINGTEQIRSGSLHELNISARVGNISRKLHWPDESLFESTQNDDIDQVVQKIKHKSKSSDILHKLERSGKWAAMGLVVTVVVVALYFRYGLPASSRYVAGKIPVGSAELISENALASMDKLSLFNESTLDEAEKAKIQAQFDSLIAKIPNEGFTLKLHFRYMLGIPNALALPGGDIIVTDAFIDLIEDPGELDAVLLHEIGHVVERHGLTQVVQASTLSVIVAMVVGDLSGVGELATSIPVFLMESNYSRKSEASADEYSFKHLAELGIDPGHFANIILKLTDMDMEDIEVDVNPDEEREINEYLSSHPGTESRARRALELSKEFNKR